MNRHEFDNLLQKYLSGNCTEDEARQVEVWSECMLERSGLELSAREKSVLEQRIWKKLSGRKLGADSFWRTVFFSKGSLAASFVLVAVLLGWISRSYTGLFGAQSTTFAAGAELNTVTQEGVITFQSEGKPTVVTLEDGTKVTLSKESTIRYPVKFDQHVRKVFLDGEAFFEVSKMAGRPFFVYSGDVVAKVLGTSFNVRSSPGGKVEVEVISGSVSVYKNSGEAGKATEGVVLTPNQKAVSDIASEKIAQQEVDQPIMVRRLEQPDALVFEDAPLVDVLNSVGDAFEIEILIGDQALKTCVFTGDLAGLPLHTQLRLICRSVNGQYELRGNVYYITGKGCDS